ncbi:hypothetical protein R5R35_012339 [Gryllus longicercus]|uniref:Glutathione peroxidase n=1 Tax=Gryllus longicercus TaxID=2509291 RepID=A0AAN9VG47_9ORTH
MNALQSEMGQDFVALGFPCNQFELQEPGNNASEILNGIKYVRPGNGFEPNFQMFSKIDVNGEKELPLFTYLKSRCPSTRNYFSDKHSLTYNRFEHADVRWNWEKFLISKTGKPIKRYDASTDPFKIRGDIQRLLRRNN